MIPDLGQFKERANILTVYAVDSRYPVPYGDINKKEAVEAHDIARDIFEFVLNALPGLSKE